MTSRKESESERLSVHLAGYCLAVLLVSCEDIDIVNDITQYLEFASDSPDFVTVLFCVYEVAGPEGPSHVVMYP